MRTVLLDTDDLAKAEQVLGQTYGAVRISGTPSDATHLRISRRSLGPLCMDEAEISYDISYDADSSEKIYLCRVRSGLIEERLPADA